MKSQELIYLNEAILEFFGLKVNPFTNTPNLDFHYESKSFQEGYSALYYVISRRLGFALITGEVGTGKTQLLRYFLKTSPFKMSSALVLNPLVKPKDLFKLILSDFGVKEASKVKEISVLTNLLYDFTLKKAQEGERVVVFIDEAQDLPLDTMESLRLISNFETEDSKLIDIILVGQPELEKKLERYELRQLNQRIWVRVKLRPLDIDEIEPYLVVRFERAGAGRIFDNFIIGEVYNFSKGIPRLINALMERAMLAAFVDENKIIRPRHIKRAIESLMGES